MYRSVFALLFASVLLLSGCAAERQRIPREKDTQGTDMAGQSSDMSGEEGMYIDTTENVIYLAGGCFWGMEQLMQSIPGVIDAQSGYANGTCEADATYQPVCKGDTGFRETVRVEYDPEQVSLDALLLAYFYVIDPTVQNRQGNDRGSQYQTGVYYTNESARDTVKSDELFSGNAVTVINFWFTTCGPCVGELAELDALNKELAEKGGSLIGVNAFTLDGDEAAISEAKDVLAKKGATYQNVYFDSDGEAGKFTTNIFAYPTTYVVDRSGNIVGEPIVGAITEKKQAETLQTLIDQVLAADMG